MILFVARLLFGAFLSAFALSLPASAESTNAIPAIEWKVLLVAGGNEEPVFDNGRTAMRDFFIGAGVPAANIRELSADRAHIGSNVRAATIANIEDALARFGIAKGAGCLLFVTAHGKEDGLFMSFGKEWLDERRLDAILTRTCGDAPTVAILSGCHSGIFVSPAMLQPNRIILTASVRERPSFGCGSSEKLTYFDQCLLKAVPNARDWPAVYGAIKECVTHLEDMLKVLPSEPQAFFGEAVKALPLPGMR